MKKKKVIDVIICQNCKYKIAKMYRRPDGSRELEVPDGMMINIIDKEKNLATVDCPSCGASIPVDWQLLARF